jgi:hypothetical protein
MLCLRRGLRRITSCLLVSLLLSTVAASACLAEERAGLLEALNSIRADELQDHVDALASDDFEGREGGRRGGRAAGDLLGQHFADSGLKGGGQDGGFFQPFRSSHRNILGLLEGSDPELKKEIIVVGAHYDHVGYGHRRNSYGPWGYIHNGADDNASGVAGILEALDAFVSLVTPPRRSILFALWDGEEQGLLGSKHFMREPTVDRDQIVFAVNVDMIGRLRNQRLMVFGTRTGYGLRRLVSECNQDLPLVLDFDWEMKANSDHYPFLSNQVPYVMLHTGMHDDCHRPSDDAHLINSTGMQHSSRLLFNLVYALAEQDQMSEFRTACRRESPSQRKQVERPIAARPPRLGVRWQPESVDEGLKLDKIQPNSAAARSGLKVGDLLVSFDGQPVTETTKFAQQVLAARSPVRATVRRGGELLELELELDQQPTRVGVSWREDDASPGTVLLTRVIPNSPAWTAGIRPGDRVYAVCGHRFLGTEDFVQLVTSLPSPLEVTFERDGRVQDVSLDVPPPTATEL